jgi:hypothetical protein
MWNDFTLLKKKTYFNECPGQYKITDRVLPVARHNKQMAAAGRTKTTYTISDHTNDPAYAGSFFLVPDLYADQPATDEYHTVPVRNAGNKWPEHFF